MTPKRAITGYFGQPIDITPIIGVILAATILTLFSAGSAHGQSSSDALDWDSIEAEVESLPWEKGPGAFSLGNSFSKVALGEHMEILRGDAVHRYLFLTNGATFPEAVAVVFSPFQGIILIEYSDVGYVRDEDWSSIDADDLIDDISATMAERNKQRIANGYPSLSVRGWKNPPIYQQDSNTVHWSLLLTGSEQGNFSNAVALKLGRNGYLGFSISEVGGAVVTPEAAIANILAVHSFDRGARYEDFSEGDRVAGVTLAGLVTVAAGAKLGKGGIVALLAATGVFLKKGIGLIVPAAILAIAWFRRRVRRKHSRDVDFDQ